MSNLFGRDEMHALLGGGSQNNNQEETTAFRPQSQRDKNKSQRPNAEPDVASMTAAETAALLMEKTSSKQQQVAASSSARYRTTKVLAHHELAKELTKELEIKEARLKQTQESSLFQQEQETTNNTRGNDSEEDMFVARKASSKRERVAPQIVSRSREQPKIVSQRKRRVYDDSSSSDDSDTRSKRQRRPARRRQQGSDESSSSSDEEEDRRRQRILARRKRDEPEIIIPKSEPQKRIETKVEPTEEPRKPAMPEVRIERDRKAKPKQQESSSESSDSSGDDSSSDSSSEEEQVMAKPLFVPKNKRNLVQSEEKKWEEEESRHEREKERVDKRKMESRAMLAKTVATVQASTNDEDVDEESGGATTAPPNDDDDIDREESRDAWELRELGRLLTAMDQQKELERTRLEYERRRQMTDGECLQEDTQAGRYQAPGSNRQQGAPTGTFLQRFYHRGAFYMDEQEWDETDVRHKAAEYAKAATGEDKIDKAKLPEVMQVKNFGMARQNMRYKGLAKEDTTDKNMEILPLVQKRK
jgi:microfibrillar-associated protein 1